MKFIAALFLCLSVLGAEQLQQAVTVPANQSVTFALKGYDDGRGQEVKNGFLYETRTAWTGLTWSAATVAKMNANRELIESRAVPVDNTFYEAARDWNDLQTLPINLVALLTQVNASVVQAPMGQLTFSNAFNPGNNSGPQSTYTPGQNFIGTDTFVLGYRAGFAPSDFAQVTVTITVSNTAPTINLQASPMLLLAGGSVAFVPTTSDANGHTVTVSYDYGDGQTGTASTHVYSAPGVYTVTATADDGFGGVATAQTLVTVVGDDHVPTARYSTSAPASVVGDPVVFDAVFSTDPQNSALVYAWDFGDGSPIGSGVTIAKAFTSAGSFVVSLTVTDGEGFSNTVSRPFDVVATGEPEQFGVTFESRVNRSKPGADILNVSARFNMGTATIADGAPVAVELAGTRFDATLDKKLRRMLPDAKWTVKQIRNKPGTVELKLQARKRTLSNGFESLGVTQTSTRAAVPVRVECAGKSLVVSTSGEFKYNRPGTKFNGGGKSGD